MQYKYANLYLTHCNFNYLCLSNFETFELAAAGAGIEARAKVKAVAEAIVPYDTHTPGQSQCLPAVISALGQQSIAVFNTCFKCFTSV